jgi:hypothetical protein
LLCMARPMALSRFYAEQKKVDTMKRQPKDVSEVAFLELQAFRNQVEMNDMMSQNYYGGW